MSKTYSERPHINLPSEGLDKVLELIGALLMAAFLVVVAASWSSLPEQLPTHFAMNGEPDAWGGRGQALWLPGIALVQFIVLTVLTRMPHRYNYPWPITPENAERQYGLARRLLHGMKLLIVLLFFAMYLGSWGVAVGRIDGLSGMAMVAILAPIFGLLLWYFIAARRAR
jgi:hypothetical protein